MNDPWLNEIKKRMSDLEIDEPSGLWHSIESRRMTSVENNARTPIYRRILLRAAVAAVLLATVVTTGFFLLNEDISLPKKSVIADNTGKSNGNISSENVTVNSVTKNIMTEENYLTEEIAMTKGNIGISTNTVDKTPASILPAVSSEPGLSDIISPCDSNQSENTDSIATESILKNDLPNYPAYAYSGQISSPTDNKHGGNGIRIGLFASGISSSSDSRTAQINATDASLGYDGAAWEGSPVLGMLLFNKGNRTTRKIKHHQPVTFGLSVSYGLTHNLDIESGITYSRLSSDSRDGSEKYYYVGNQTLNYIGVPLNIKYKFLTWNFIDVYASAGTQLQKCVSGKIEKRYVIENVTQSSETEDINIKPLQWSVNAAVGVQFRINDFLGIYVEPGAGYWFDNNSDISTIYSDKPINFNLNVGVRFNVGK